MLNHEGPYTFTIKLVTLFKGLEATSLDMYKHKIRLALHDLDFLEDSSEETQCLQWPDCHFALLNTLSESTVDLY